MQNSQNVYSKIPPIQEIDKYLEAQGLKYGREVRITIQTLLIDIRRDTAWLADEDTTRGSILERIGDHLEQRKQELVPVINATGAIIHTNLGRSVFSPEIFQGIFEIGTSYTNLEFSLETGKRGARLSNVGNLLKTLTGAEEVVVVNNNAAAVLLTLITFSQGREVIISRGELVEIGGSFRIPEIIGISGATLREVGTTNRTRIEDYENALSEQTAVLLKVHTSNYQVLGFTETVSTVALSKLAKKADKILVEDLGSGALTDFIHPSLNTEPLVPQVLKDGIDIVTFSGDKLLGGPQAGIILGKKPSLDRIRRHPLYRALRCDKLTMLLLEKTLLAYTKNKQSGKIPTQRMLNESVEEISQRVASIAEGLDTNTFKAVDCESTAGGGSLPGQTIPSRGILISKPGWSDNRLMEYLRRSLPPVIGRISHNQVVLDCRTVLPHQIPLLKEVLKTIQDE